MSINVILKLKIVYIRSNQLLAILFVNSLYGVQHILSHVFVSVLLEHISGKRLFIVSDYMDEVTKLSSGTSLWSMIIFARNGTVVSYIDQSLFAWGLWLVTDLFLL